MSETPTVGRLVLRVPGTMAGDAHGLAASLQRELPTAPAAATDRGIRPAAERCATAATLAPEDIAAALARAMEGRDGG